MTDSNKESIFDFIDRNIKMNGTLPREFSLNDYIVNDEEKNFVLGGLDGLTYFHTKIEPNKKVTDFVISSLKELNSKNISLIVKKVQDYFNEHKEERILNNVDAIITYINKHRDEIDVNNLYNFSASTVLNGTNIEAVKLGISLFSLINLSKEQKLIEVLEKFAICDEFTLFATFVLKKVQDSNQVIFRLAKKTEGWGKIFLVSSLKADDDIIKEWMLTDGCYNDILNAYLALHIAKEINLPQVLCKTHFSVEEFVGLNEIMSGLLDEQDIKGISYFKNYNFIFNRYLITFENYADLMYFYDIPIKIYTYLQDKNTMEDLLIKKSIIDLFESRKTFNILKRAIHSGFTDDFKLAVQVLNFDSRIRLHKDVMEEFQKNPFEYNFCLEYFLSSETYKDRAIDALNKSVDLQSHYSENPEAIMDTNDPYSVNLTSVLHAIKYFPFELENFVIAGLKSKTMYPRIAAINTIMEWQKISKIKTNDLNPDLLDAIVELQQKEIIKEYKVKLNKILDIKEDLEEYKDPKVEVVKKKKKINLFVDDLELDNLFDAQVRFNGKEYYNNNMVFSCVKTNNEYIGFVQGESFSEEHRVSIKMDKNELITDIQCTCHDKNHCKHEFATILYLRNKLNHGDI